MSRLAGAVVLALLLGVVPTGAGAGPGGGPGARAAAGAGESPLDVVVFLVDDMNDFSCRETADYLPRSARWLRREGRCFEHATVSDPVCCPSRAVLATGQLNHNNGVRTQRAARLLDISTTLQSILRRSGLTTYGSGKFFNGVKAQEYESGRLDSGFTASDFWNGMDYYDYLLWSDEAGSLVHPDDRVHTTRRTGDFAASFIRRMVRQSVHFYAYVGFKAPHLQNERDRQAAERFPEPSPANAHRRVPPLRWHPEHDVSDKLPIFGRLNYGRGYFESLHAARVRALYDVDDQMARILDRLEDSGRLDDTLVVFTSDNGYQLGSNGWQGKSVPYRDSLDVPLLIRYPAAFGTGVVDKRPVGLIDIAPTVYDLMGIEVSHTMDGHSLLGRHRRGGTFHEFTAEQSLLVIEESGVAATQVPSWAMYEIGTRSYLEYYNRSGAVIRREFYADRRQHRNLLAPQYAEQRPSKQVLHRFRNLLSRARSCEGTVESDADNPCP